MLDFNDWCVVFDFQGCFHTFAFLLFLIPNRSALRGLCCLENLCFDARICFAHFHVWHSKFHTTRKLKFIHTAHTGMTWHLLDLRTTLEFYRIDCITPNLFSTPIFNLFYNTAKLSLCCFIAFENCMCAVNAREMKKHRKMESALIHGTEIQLIVLAWTMN